MYGVALIAGVVVGVFYGCIGVRLPAPPVVALVGLFGILLGEQVGSDCVRMSSVNFRPTQPFS